MISPDSIECYVKGRIGKNILKYLNKIRKVIISLILIDLSDTFFHNFFLILILEMKQLSIFYKQKVLINFFVNMTTNSTIEILSFLYNFLLIGNEVLIKVKKKLLPKDCQLKTRMLEQYKSSTNIFTFLKRIMQYFSHGKYGSGKRNTPNKLMVE